jgi:class 3 adenylate cyclase
MDEVNRRLAGILAADVAGYTTKMGADDVDTLARVRTLRTDVIEPFAATQRWAPVQNHGRWFLLEFPSSVQALRCAIAIQTALNAQAEASACGSGCIRVRWWRKATTCPVTASSSPPGWNHWPKAVAS